MLDEACERPFLFSMYVNKHGKIEDEGLRPAVTSYNFLGMQKARTASWITGLGGNDDRIGNRCKRHTIQ